MVDTAIVTAIAAVGGSVLGGMASLTATNLAQRDQGRRERLLKEQDRRENLYVKFIKVAADRYVDALDHTLDNPTALMEFFSLVGRIRLFSTREVLLRAEAVAAHLIDRYRQPPLDAIEALARRNDIVAPLAAFTEACRLEREAVLRRI
jgi:hypothetical protein